MKGEIELYNISFLILKVELHFKLSKLENKGVYRFECFAFCNVLHKEMIFSCTWTMQPVFNFI